MQVAPPSPSPLNQSVDLAHSDFVALVETINLFTSPASATQATSPQGGAESATFGLKISSRILTLRIAEDEIDPAPLAYIFAVRDPLVEIYNSTVSDVARLYIGLLASDISLYERPANEDSGTRDMFSCKGARVPQTASAVPLLHRTSLEKSWISSNFQRSKHRVLSVKFLSSEELLPDNFPSHKSSAIHISLRDMTYRFDPAPRWHTKIPKFFSLTSSGTSTPSGESQQPVQTSTTFGQTHLSVSIQKLMLDFCQPELPTTPSQSRLIVSLGLLTVNSTFISNTPRIGIKIKLSDVSLRVSNKLLQDARWEQSPLGPNGVYLEESGEVGGTNLDLDSFFDLHGLVIMSTFDHLECRIDLNSDQKNKYTSGQAIAPVVAIEATAGVCCLYGCADSLLVLTVCPPSLQSPLTSG
jgi:hypothetical protein